MSITDWRKSSRSESGSCVEVGSGEAVVGVRDSKGREAGPVLTFGAEDWKRFLAGLKGDAGVAH